MNTALEIYQATADVVSTGSPVKCAAMDCVSPWKQWLL